MQTKQTSGTWSKTRRLWRFCLAFVVIAGLCVAVTWIAGPGPVSGPAKLNLTVNPDATFKFFRQVQQDGKYDWSEVPIRPETAHEIIRRLNGAEPYVVESNWGFQWDWPPVRRDPGNAGSSAPDNGLLEVYEGGSNTPTLRVGFLVIEQRVGHALPDNARRYFFPEQHKARLFSLLGPLLD